MQGLVVGRYIFTDTSKREGFTDTSKRERGGALFFQRLLQSRAKQMIKVCIIYFEKRMIISKLLGGGRAKALLRV